MNKIRINGPYINISVLFPDSYPITPVAGRFYTDYHSFAFFTGVMPRNFRINTRWNLKL